MKIHCGINLTSVGTPEDVDTIGLFELITTIANNMNDNNVDFCFNENNILNFINTIVVDYINELNDIELDISKTKLL